MENWITFIVLFGLILLAGVFAYFIPVIHWYIASQEGIRISIFEMIRLRLKGYPLEEMLDNLVRAKRSGIEVSANELKTHYLRGGDLNNVISGMILARERNIRLDKKKAFAADLKRIDLVKGIKELEEKIKSRSQK